MITSIGQSIDALREEYGLDRELVIEAMKEAVKAAARKQFRHEYKAGEGIQVDWNDEEGMVEISAQKTVVEEVESPTTELSMEDAFEMTGDDEIEIGDMLLIPLPTEELGRIAAQTAKQILVQKVREAIREKVYDEYIDRKGELINGLVKRFERGDLIIDLGNNLEAILPRREQVRSESWTINDRIRVVISDVSKELKNQQVIVSRASAELLKRLFEMEVPEIYDDTVIIKSAVREPGDRAKIAVSSNEKDVDPVGACVGMKGSRVQSIIKELRGEKIDIIEWSDEPSVFAANALSPAKVSQVRITDINERKMEVIVSEDQLSLAIGKRGQNVRLATRLVGWDIDIISEEILKQEITQQMGEMMASGQAVPISALEGISVVHIDLLAEKGIEDIESLAKTNVDDLVEIIDISLDEASDIIESAKKVVELKEAKPQSSETEDSTETSENVEAPTDENATSETSEETGTTENPLETEEKTDDSFVQNDSIETSSENEIAVSENTETEELKETPNQDSEILTESNESQEKSQIEAEGESTVENAEEDAVRSETRETALNDTTEIEDQTVTVESKTEESEASPNESEENKDVLETNETEKTDSEEE